MKVSSHPTLSVVSSDEDTDIVLPDGRPLVPDGRYHFKLDYHETSLMFGSPRLILLMTILDCGDFNGVSLPRYYNVDRLIGKPRKNGRFVPSRGGDFLIDYYTLLPERSQRLDRLPMAPLKDKFIFAETSTVKTNNRNTKLPEPMWHSKIKKLIELRTDFSP